MSKKILFIQNNFIFQEKDRNAIKKAGLVILNASDGETGLALIKKERPSLVLLDLALPKKDGATIVKEVRADEKISNIPVIFLINIEEISEVEKLLRLGNITYFVMEEEDGELENLIVKIKNYL